MKIFIRVSNQLGQQANVQDDPIKQRGPTLKASAQLVIAQVVQSLRNHSSLDNVAVTPAMRWRVRFAKL
jgi:hypothetical protein